MKGLHIKKILVPIDFSDNAMNALNTAICMARQHGAAIKLLFVHNTCEKYYPEMNLANAHDVVKALTTLSRLIKADENVPCDFSYVNADVVNCIIQNSVNEKADIIIMGKNGNSGKRKKCAGSVAYSIVGKARCPVLLVPAGNVWDRFNKILFPVRPALTMLEKYEMIKELIKANNADVYLLNLRNPSYINELHIISRLVTLLKTRLKNDNINNSISYYFKDTFFADKIISVAHDSKTKIDLLVILAENQTKSDFYLSAYAQQLIHQSNIPVLLIKSGEIALPKKVVLQELEKGMCAN